MTHTQRNIIVSLILASGFIVAGCERSEFNCQNCPVENWEDPELLPPITVKYLDAVPTMGPLDLANIYLPNYWSVNDYLQTFDIDFYNNWREKVPYAMNSFDMNTFIARVTFLASKLTDRSSFQFPAGGPNKPAQNGLAYVYGSDDFTSRRTSLQSGDANALCDDELYGIDCSGLFKYVMERNGMQPFYNTIDSLTYQVRTNHAWISNFSNSNDYQAVDFGQQPLSFVKPGDIIYWQFSDHQKSGLIGIVIEDQNKELGVLLSSGSAYNDCERNFSFLPDSNSKRGPRILHLESFLPLLSNSFSYLYGTQPANADSVRFEGGTYTQVRYNVMRIIPDFSGTASRSQTEYPGTLDTCNYRFFLSDINLSLSFLEAIDKKGATVYGEVYYRYNVIGQNCTYIYNEPEQLRASVYFSKDYIDLDFGEGALGGYFKGFFKDNTIVGELTVIKDGIPYITPMILYPK